MLEDKLGQQQAEVEKQVAEAKVTEASLDRCRRAIDFIRSVNGSALTTPATDQSGTTGHQDATVSSTPSGAPESRSEIVIALLSRYGPLWPREMRSRARTLGWVTDDPAEGNRLAVTASRLAHKGRLERRGDERYAIPGQLSHPTTEDS